MSTKKYYEILGVDQDAELETIKKAFRKQVAIYHPDVNPKDEAKEQFQNVVEAFDVLSDEEKRNQYDEMLSQQTNLEPLYPEQEMVLDEWETTSKRRSDNYKGMDLEDLLMLGFIADAGAVDGLLDSAGDIIDSAADAMDGLFDLF